MNKDFIFTLPNGVNFSRTSFLPPPKSGVYIICARSISDSLLFMDNQHILYVGSSKNIYKRILNPNHIFRKMTARSSHHVYILWHLTENYLPLEIQAIKLIRPMFNKDYNG